MLFKDREFWVRVGRVTCMFAVMDAMMALAQRGAFAVAEDAPILSKAEVLPLERAGEVCDQIWMGWVLPPGRAKTPARQPKPYINTSQ